MDCPNCKANLDGDLIFDTFLTQYGGDRIKALKSAEAYGATETTGRWRREIAQYSLEEDRTVAFRCPDCNHRWPR